MAENIYEVASRFKRALLNQERDAAVRLVEAYGTAYARLSAQIKKLTDEIEKARAAGETVDQAWLIRQQRYFNLLNQVIKEISKFADLAGLMITDQQKRAVDQALQDSQTLLLAAMDQAPEGISAEFNRINPSAVESLVGFLSDGSPLTSLLSRQGPAAALAVREELTDGVVQGRNPQEIARRIRKRLYKNEDDVPSGQLHSFLRLSRTETFRAYREASQRNFEANSDIIDGWIWLSALNARSCAACIALHGTFHPATERMKAHVNCRCTQIPHVGGADLNVERGADWFRRQPEAVKKEILDSPGAFEAYQSGQLRLEDFVGLKRSAQWGDGYRVLGVERALAGEGQFPGDVPRQAVRAPVPATPPARVIPPLSPLARARIEAAAIDEERIDVNKLGLPNNPLAPLPSGKVRKRKIELDPSLITLSRDDLNKDRLLRLEQDLAGGVVSQKSFNIGVVEDPANPGRYIVYGDGNHRVAYLQLVGYREPIQVELVEQVTPKPRKLAATQGPLETYARSAPKDIKLKMKDDARARLNRMFGRDIENEELAWAVGALDGAEVQAFEMGDGSIYVIIEHPEIDSQERYLVQEAGRIIIKNEYFRAARNASKGVGIRSFAREVFGAQQLGIGKIKTYAAGEGPHDKRFNGYYTWARFGYNAKLPSLIQERLPAELKSKDLNELFSKPGGPEWWRQNGSGRHMEFDLTPGSESERRLLEYLRDREQRERDRKE